MSWMNATLKRAAIAAMAGTMLTGLGTGDVRAEEEALVTFKIMRLSVAQEMANAALKACRDKGYQVAIVVVDRFGQPQVLLRDRFAGPHTPETARRKAWTSVSFRTETLELGRLTKAGTDLSGLRFVSDAMVAGGGMPVEAAGSIVGGIGVSGAPSGAEDQACAEAGIDAVADQLAF